MKFYLSGPITGVLNFEHTFEVAGRELIKKANHYGMSISETDIINPCVLGKPLIEYHKITNNRAPTWEEFMRRDIKALCDCDAIVMLQGWRDSRGAKVEHHVAHELGLTAIYL